MSNVELVSLYQKKILPLLEQFYIRMWSVCNIGTPLVNVVKQMLEAHVVDEQKVKELLLVFSTPRTPNEAMIKQMDLLDIHSRRYTSSAAALGHEIILHAEKFKHIPMFDIDHTPYSKEQALKELHSISDAKATLKKRKTKFHKERHTSKQHMQTLFFSKKLQRLLFFLQENVILRDYRDMIRQKLNLALRDLYGEIGRRLNLDVDQVIMLTNKEIIRHLTQHKPFSQSEMNARKKAFLMIQKGDQIRIYSGSCALKKVKQELGEKTYKPTKSISGTSGSKGKAKGPVKIIYTNKDLDKIKKGDVLVTPMTRQDFVPVLSKVAAIITDEGSITCHAAIIARELDIPCIVGTSVATQLLYDGEIVEVDTDTETIRRM